MTFETEIEKNRSTKGLGINVLRFFWEVSPLVSRDHNSLPKFLRGQQIFANFSDNELRIFSKYLHRRYFNKDEVIFKYNDLGVGFYLIFNGNIEITYGHESISLERSDYFGELAILQENNLRNATALAKEPSTVLGFFKPDLNDLIQEYPAIATKLLQSLSSLVADRIFLMTREITRLKEKVLTLEGGHR